MNMKSKMKIVMAAWLLALVAPVVPCQADDEPACEVVVAALTLPDGSDGLLHVRVANTATTPLQLSTRYFSERVKLPGRVVQFHKDPVAAEPAPPLPEPLLAVKIPSDTKLAYLVLWSETGENNQARWRSRLFDAKDWAGSSLKVLNASSEQLGISAGQKRMLLASGKSADFRARDWREPFPVKIFRLKPEQKNIFSSTWRVTAGRRELCFIVDLNGTVSLRSLLELTAPPAEPAP